MNQIPIGYYDVAEIASEYDLDVQNYLKRRDIQKLSSKIKVHLGCSPTDIVLVDDKQVEIVHELLVVPIILKHDFGYRRVFDLLWQYKYHKSTPWSLDPSTIEFFHTATEMIQALRGC